MIYTKTMLAKYYGVSYNTFLKWMKHVPDLQLSKGQRVLTPRQTQKVIEFLGTPPFISKYK